MNNNYYVSQGTTVELKYSSRVSVKVADTFYTFEATESRTVPYDLSDEELADERELLWDTVNSEVDNQVEKIINLK